MLQSMGSQRVGQNLASKQYEKCTKEVALLNSEREANTLNLKENVGDEKNSLGNNIWISRGINRRKFVIMFM